MAKRKTIHARKREATPVVTGSKGVIRARKTAGKRVLSKGSLQKRKPRGSKSKKTASKKSPLKSKAASKSKRTQNAKASTKAKPALKSAPKPKLKKGEPGYVSPADRVKQWQYKKGQAQPQKRGRPKGSLGLSAYLRKVINKNLTIYGKDGHKMQKSVAQTLIDTALEHAKKGRYSYFKEIWDRLEGKVPDHVIQETTKKIIKQETEQIAIELLELVAAKADKYMTEKLADKFLEEISTELHKRYADPPSEETKDG